MGRQLTGIPDHFLHKIADIVRICCISFKRFLAVFFSYFSFFPLIFTITIVFIFTCLFVLTISWRLSHFFVLWNQYHLIYAEPTQRTLFRRTHALQIFACLFLRDSWCLSVRVSEYACWHSWCSVNYLHPDRQRCRDL